MVAPSPIMTREPSPEVKAIIREFCRVQRAKYGPDWKHILAKEMAEKSAPYVAAILNMSKRNASA
jgi:hypothetical protein